MSSFSYRAYGLLIDSAVPIPELTEIDESGPARTEADVVVRTGTVPDHLEDPRYSSTSEASADHLLLRIDGVARYLVSHGSSVTIDPTPGADSHEVRVFLLGTCFGALLHQRGLLVLHASGIGTSSGAALFAGASGAGKSTLLGELLRRGERMMVDDVCGIYLDEASRPIVTPSYPRTRTWADSAALLDVDTSGLTRTRPEMEKFERQLPEQFWDRDEPLIRIYHLAGAEGDEVTLTPLSAMEAFPTVLDNTYRRILLDGFDLRRRHFDLASAVATSTRIVRVTRPATGYSHVELADRILEDLHDAGTAG